MTTTIDLLKQFEFRTCARPDCAKPFPVKSKHENDYCPQYCAHLESVRLVRTRISSTEYMICMATYKRGTIYWYKFMWKGELVRESTKQKNNKVARDMESAHRTALAKGEVGIREKRPAPTLRNFLKDEFLPFAETKHAVKPMTLRYYKQGSAMLTKTLGFAGLRLDEVTDQHAQDFARHHSTLSSSGINRGLRTLRRALNLAYQWASWRNLLRSPWPKEKNSAIGCLRMTKKPEKYLKACPQPWRDCATIILDEGFRPGEVFALHWPHGCRMVMVPAGFKLWKANRRQLGVSCP